MWHTGTDLGRPDAVVLPGGFAHGDHLRTGAIARFSPVMRAVADFAGAGGPVIGSCNGFQVLTEAGLLPGALLRNDHLEFRCDWQWLRVERPSSSPAWLGDLEGGEVIRLPISHGEGRYVADAETLDALESAGRVVLRYADERGAPTPEANPNGSERGIAGIVNERETCSASCRTRSAPRRQRSAAPTGCGCSGPWNAGCGSSRPPRSVGYDRAEGPLTAAGGGPTPCTTSASPVPRRTEPIRRAPPISPGRRTRAGTRARRAGPAAPASDDDAPRRGRRIGSWPSRRATAARDLTETAAWRAPPRDEAPPPGEVEAYPAATPARDERTPSAAAHSVPSAEGAVGESTQCPRCGTENRPGLAFCRNCGQRLMAAGVSTTVERPGAPEGSMACPRCGTHNRTGVAFCQNCGANLRGVGSRLCPSRRGGGAARGRPRDGPSRRHPGPGRPAHRTRRARHRLPAPVRIRLGLALGARVQTRRLWGRLLGRLSRGRRA